MRASLTASLKSFTLNQKVFGPHFPHEGVMTKTLKYTMPGIYIAFIIPFPYTGILRDQVCWPVCQEHTARGCAWIQTRGPHTQLPSPTPGRCLVGKKPQLCLFFPSGEGSSPGRNQSCLFHSYLFSTINFRISLSSAVKSWVIRHFIAWLFLQ